MDQLFQIIELAQRHQGLQPVLILLYGFCHGSQAHKWLLFGPPFSKKVKPTPNRARAGQEEVSGGPRVNQVSEFLHGPIQSPASAVVVPSNGIESLPGTAGAEACQHERAIRPGEFHQ